MKTIPTNQRRPASHGSGVINPSLPTGFTSTTESVAKKPVYERQAKTVLSYSVAFGHKHLCTGPVLNLEDACPYMCSFCYVPAMMHKLVFPLLRAAGKKHEEVIIRRSEPLQILEKQLRGRAGVLSNSDRRKKHVVFTSTTSDPAATMDSVRLTAEAIKMLFAATNWDVRVLSKSNLLPKLAELIPTKWKHRVIYGVSTGTMDDTLAKAFEQGTPLVSKRIQSLHWLQDNGYRTFGMICPSLPQEDYLGFSEEACKAIRVDRCEHVWAEVINLRGESFARTVNALLAGGFAEEANQLAKVSGPGAGPSWEKYSRATFLAHAANIGGAKLRYLQYVDPDTVDWWEPYQSAGAVLLGKHAP